MGCVSCRSKSHSTVSPSRDKLNNLMLVSYRRHGDLVEGLKEMMTYRAETIVQMRAVADELDRKHRDVNIAKLIASSASVVGGVVRGVGFVLSPVMPGTSLATAAVVAGTAAIIGGKAASAGADIYEKVLESKQLEKVECTLNRDREQCEKVQKLWTEQESYFSGIVDTIECANLSKEPDMKLFKEWVLSALKKTKSKVAVIAEPLHSIYVDLHVTASREKLTENHAESAAEPTAEKLSNALVNTAMGVLGEKIDLVDVVQFIAENVFQLSAAAALGDVVEFIKVLIDAHKCSLSKVAEEIRELSSKLENEHNKWKNVFADLK